MKVTSILNFRHIKSFFVFAILLAAIFTTKTASASVTESEIIELTNKERAGLGLGGLVENPTLSRAAALKAQDMAVRGYFSHNTPDGRTPWSFMKDAGYAYVSAGENLAVDFYDSSSIMRAWMNSPGHRANIANGNYEEIGVAYAKGIYKGRETLFVVQMFGIPEAKSATYVEEPSYLYRPAPPTAVVPVAPVLVAYEEQVLNAKVTKAEETTVEEVINEEVEVSTPALLKLPIVKSKEAIKEGQEVRIENLMVEKEAEVSNVAEPHLAIEDNDIYTSDIKNTEVEINSLVVEEREENTIIKELAYVFEDFFVSLTTFWKRVRLAIL